MAYLKRVGRGKPWMDGISIFVGYSYCPVHVHIVIIPHRVTGTGCPDEVASGRE